MKARILDSQVKVYSGFDTNDVSIATLTAGNEVEVGAPKRKSGKLWLPITLSTGQQAYIPGDTHLFIVRLAVLMQNNVDLHSEPSAVSPVKQQLARNSKINVMEVVKRDGEDWVHVRDMNGMEGYISGNTALRVIQQKTKALGRKNMLTGAMWLIAGSIITFSGGSPASGGSFIVMGFIALLFGVVMLILGLVQLLTAQS